MNSLHIVQFKNCTAYTLYSVQIYTLYIFNTVQSTHCTVYTLYNFQTEQVTHSKAYTLYSGHIVQFTYFTVYTLYSLPTVQFIQCTVDTLNSLNSLQFTPCTVYTFYSLHTVFSVQCIQYVQCLSWPIHCTRYKPAWIVYIQYIQLDMNTYICFDKIKIHLLKCFATTTKEKKTIG